MRYMHLQQHRSSPSHPSSPTSPSSHPRLRSWLSLKRRRVTDKTQPSGRPPTPTPHAALSSAKAKEYITRPRILRRKHPPPVDASGLSKDEKQGSKSQKADTGNGKELLSDQDRIRMAYYANGVRGLIEELKMKDGKTRTPPMTTEDGTPLSPISEADELEPVHEPDEHVQEVEQPRPQTVLHSRERSPSSDEITDLDYGELISTRDLEMEMDANQVKLYDSDFEEEEEWRPRWNPDVAELVLSEMEEGCRLPETPSLVPRPSVTDNREGRVDDASIEREIALHDEQAVPSVGDKTQTDTRTHIEQTPTPTETEDDELEYFSAPSIPISSGEEEGGEDEGDGTQTGIGLRLRGVVLASSSSSDTLTSSLSDENDRTVEDIPMRPRTPQPLLRHRFPSPSLSNTHPMFRPDRIDGPSPKSPKSPKANRDCRKRVRAATLPLPAGGKEGREREGKRAVPTLPRLSIPSEEAKEGGKEGNIDVVELARTIAQLQREKARLEDALEHANKRIEEKNQTIEFMEIQLKKMWEAFDRLMRGEPCLSISDTSLDNSVSIVLRAPAPLDAKSNEKAVVGPSTLAPSAKAGSNALSTPPATPDRRAARVALLTDAQSTQGDRSKEEVDVDSTPKAVRSLVRRNSAGSSHVLSELGIGRAQMKRRAGSEDLKSLTASFARS